MRDLVTRPVFGACVARVTAGYDRWYWPGPDAASGARIEISASVSLRAATSAADVLFRERQASAQPSTRGTTEAERRDRVEWIVGRLHEP